MVFNQEHQTVGEQHNYTDLHEDDQPSVWLAWRTGTNFISRELMGIFFSEKNARSRCEEMAKAVGYQKEQLR